MTLFVSTEINEHCIGLKNKQKNVSFELLQRAQASPEMSVQAESC